LAESEGTKKKRKNKFSQIPRFLPRKDKKSQEDGGRRKEERRTGGEEDRGEEDAASRAPSCQLRNLKQECERVRRLGEEDGGGGGEEWGGVKGVCADPSRLNICEVLDVRASDEREKPTERERSHQPPDPGRRSKRRRRRGGG